MFFSLRSQRLCGESSHHFKRNNSDVPGALAARSVPPTTAIGRTKLDRNGIAKRKDNIAPKPVHA